MNKKNKSRNALSKVAKLLLGLTKIFLSCWSFLIMSTFYILISKCQYTTKRFSPNIAFSCITNKSTLCSLWYFPINQLFSSKNNDNSNLSFYDSEGRTPCLEWYGQGVDQWGWNCNFVYNISCGKRKKFLFFGYFRKWL